jgi:hypothetical protein
MPKPTSPAIAAAARAEGTKPSGPPPDAGTDQSSRRSPLLLPGEDAEKLAALTAAFYDYLRPENLAEGSLVDLLIADVWRAARVMGYQSEFRFTSAKDVEHVLRYVDASRKMFRSTLRDFARFRKAKGDPNQPYLKSPMDLDPSPAGVTASTVPPHPPRGPFENFYEPTSSPSSKRTQGARKSLTPKTK